MNVDASAITCEIGVHSESVSRDEEGSQEEEYGGSHVVGRKEVNNIQQRIL
jgi:hypothetical protein